MDQVPFLFIDAVAFASRYSAFAPMTKLRNRVWQAVGRTHAAKRDDLELFVIHHAGSICLQFRSELSERKHRKLSEDEFLLQDPRYVRIRAVEIKEQRSRYERTKLSFEEMRKRLEPCLSSVSMLNLHGRHSPIIMEKLDFVWKVPTRTVDSLILKDCAIMQWHILNNEKLREVESPMYDDPETIMDVVHLRRNMPWIKWRVTCGAQFKDLRPSIQTWIENPESPTFAICCRPYRRANKAATLRNLGFVRRDDLIGRFRQECGDDTRVYSLNHRNGVGVLFFVME